jgi:hypothetical protein
MKIRFYCDLWPGLDPVRFTLMASTLPVRKPDGAKRLAFDVQIPDHLLYAVDAESPEVRKVEVLDE